MNGIVGSVRDERFRVSSSTRLACGIRSFSLSSSHFDFATRERGPSVRGRSISNAGTLAETGDYVKCLKL